MTHAWTVLVAMLPAAALMPSASLADGPTAGPDEQQVIVIRGTRTTVYSPQPAAKASGQSRSRPATDEIVVVDRPAAGSFMRETSRLAAEAEAREERAAREAAREASQQMARTLRAIEEAALAAEEEARARSDRYYPVYVPRPHPRRTAPPPKRGQRLRS